MQHNQPQTQQPYTFSQEVYGFARFISSTVLVFLYLAFAFIPNSQLESWGVIFYPAKYWFLAIPSLIIFSILLLIFNYIAFNFKNTNSPYNSDAFLRDNLSRRIRNEDVADTMELYRTSLKQQHRAQGMGIHLEGDLLHGPKIAQIYRDIDIDPSKINPVDERPILDSFDLAPTLLTQHLVSQRKLK